MRKLGILHKESDHVSIVLNDELSVTQSVSNLSRYRAASAAKKRVKLPNLPWCSHFCILKECHHHQTVPNN